MSEEELLAEMRRNVTHVVAQIDAIALALNGKEGALGLSQKVAIMWRLHTWLLVAVSTLVSSLVTAYILHRP